MVYLQESNFDIGINNDPDSFSQSMESDDYDKWVKVMNKETKSMDHNGVWELVELSTNCKILECKRVYKTKLMLGVTLRNQFIGFKENTVDQCILSKSQWEQVYTFNIGCGWHIASK